MQADLARRRRAPGWPLLAVLGLHLLLAWSWRIAHPPAPDARVERVFELVPLPAPAARPAPPRPAIAPAPASSSARARAPLREADAITPPPAAPAPVADPFATEATPAPGPAPLEALVGQAKRDAIAIDRELRKGKSGVPDAAGTPWARLPGAIEAAYKDRSLTVTSETYTTPDGQVIYRFRHGGKVRCRSSGAVTPKIGGAVGGGEVLFDGRGGEGRAGEVRCPSQAEFRRD